MSGITDKISNRIKMDIEDLPDLRTNAADKCKDKDGSSSFMVAMTLRFLGGANYILYNNIGSI